MRPASDAALVDDRNACRVTQVEDGQGERAVVLAASSVPDSVTDHLSSHEADVVKRGMAGQEASDQGPQCRYYLGPPWDHGHGLDPGPRVHDEE